MLLLLIKLHKKSMRFKIPDILQAQTRINLVGHNRVPKLSRHFVGQNAEVS